jgi:hypothetical protein
MAEVIEVGIRFVGADKAGKQIDNVDKATKDLGTGVSAASTALDKMTGGAVTGFRNAVGGVRTFIKGLKLTKVALISTGIGAIVVAVGALVGFFLKTNKGAKALKVGLAALGAIVERVTGYFQAAGAFIVGLFSGGVTEAVSAYNAEIEKLPGSMMDAIKKTMELENRTQRLRTAQREMTVAFAEGRAQIKEYNLIAEDITRGLEEREAAAKKAITIEKKLMAQRQAAAQEEFEIAKQRAALSDTSEEDLDNLAALEANLINIRTESAEMQTTLNNKLNTIRQQSAAKAKQAADAIVAAEKEKQAAIEATIKKREQLKALTDAVYVEGLSRDDKELEQHYKKYRALFKIEQDYRDQLRKDKAEDWEYEVEESITREDAMNEAMIAAGDRLREMQQERRETEANIHKEYLKSEEIKELEAFWIKHDALMAAAEEAGGASNALKEKLDAERQAIIDKFGKAEADTAVATAAAVKAANEGVVAAGFQALNAMAKTEEQGRQLAIAQILVNQGIALSNAIASAQQSATATGPGAVFTAPGFTATMIALVLGSFAQIKGIMNQAGAAAGGIGSGGGGGGGGGGTSSSFRMGLTPEFGAIEAAGAIPPVQAYVVQTQLADENAMAAAIQSKASL